MSDREKKNNRIGVLASVGIHTALFLAFFFLMAWRAPNPPLPEYGIELNFGLDDEGSGDVQPEKPVGDVSGTETEQTEQTTETKSEEVKTEEATKDDSAPEKSVEQAVSKIESPVAIKEEKKDVPDVVKVKPAETKPKETIKADSKKDETKAVDPAASAKKGDPGSHGDDSQKAGDKGSEEGTLDSKALYGTPGGGGGGTGLDLQMSGWAWAEKPVIPDLPDNENGKVIFEITCDENGDIVGIETIERSLSPKAEQMLKEEIRKNSLVKTSGGQPRDRSKGRIVFVLKTK